MSVHTNQVFDYLDTHPVSRYEGDFRSLLEMLHYIYTTCNPINGETIRDGFRKMRSVIDKLPMEEQDALFSCVCDLCYEYEQQAFYHGLAAGMHLMAEINGLSHTNS